MTDTPLNGIIDSRNLLNLLSSLLGQNATGSLKVTGPAYHKQVYLRSGRILFASSNDPRDQLGSILVESGKLTAEQLADVQARVDPGHPLAKVLSESGLITQQELGEAARSKVERILRDVLTCVEGTYEFEDGVLPKGAIDLKLPTDSLLLSAVRDISDRGYVLRQIEGLDVVLTPQSVQREHLEKLNEATDGLAMLFDGRSTLRELVVQTRLDEFEGAKIACGLMLLNLLEWPEDSSRTEAESPFFVSTGQNAEEIDLGQTAQMAIDEVAGISTANRALTPVPLAKTTPIPSSPPLFPSFEERQEHAAEDTLPPLGSDAPEGNVPIGELPSIAPPVLPFLSQPPEPEEKKPPFPTIQPPSREDLAALGSFLGQDTGARAYAPRPPRPAPARFARFGPQGAARRDTVHSGTRPLLLILVVIAVLAGAGGYWYFVLTPRSTAAPSSQAPVTLATLPPPTLATSTAATATPLAMLPSPTPATAALNQPSVAITPAPTTSTSARSLLARGRYRESAQAFASELRRQTRSFTVQLLVACSDDTIQKALQTTGSDRLVLLPVRFKGQACHRLCWDVYPNEAEAQAARARIPQYFIQGGASPRVVTIGSILE